MKIDPLYPFDATRGTVPSVVPFTIRENPSLLMLVEEMRKWISVELVPFINENIQKLADAWEEQVNRLVAAWGEKIIELETAWANKIIELDAKWTELSERLIAEVQTIFAEMQTMLAEAKAAKDAAERARDSSKVSADNSAASALEAKTYLAEMEAKFKTLADALIKKVEDMIAAGGGGDPGAIQELIDAVNAAKDAAELAKVAAEAARDKSKTSETNAKQSEIEAKAARDAALAAKNGAESARDAAKVSENNAKASENNAKASEVSVGNSVAGIGSTITNIFNDPSSEFRQATDSAYSGGGSGGGGLHLRTAQPGLMAYPGAPGAVADSSGYLPDGTIGSTIPFRYNDGFTTLFWNVDDGSFEMPFIGPSGLGVRRGGSTSLKYSSECINVVDCSRLIVELKYYSESLTPNPDVSSIYRLDLALSVGGEDSEIEWNSNIDSWLQGSQKPQMIQPTPDAFSYNPIYANDLPGGSDPFAPIPKPVNNVTTFTHTFRVGNGAARAWLVSTALSSKSILGLNSVKITVSK